MRKNEVDELLDSVWHELCHKGMPINIRKGTDMDIADYVKAIVEEHITIDKPLGTVMGYDYDACPNCGGMIGTTAKFCKRCGAYIRI